MGTDKINPQEPRPIRGAEGVQRPEGAPAGKLPGIALAMDFFHAVEGIDHKIKGARDAIVYAQFAAERDDLNARAAEQRELAQDALASIDQAKNNLGQLQVEMEAWEENLYQLPPTQRNQVLAEKKNSLLAMKNDVSILPIQEEEVHIPMVPPGNAPRGPQIGLGGGNSLFLMRRAEMMKMIEELLAMIEQIEQDGVPATGYPLSQIVIANAIIVIEHREVQAIQLAEIQEALNGVSETFTQLLQLFRRLDQNTGPNGGSIDPAEMRRIINEIREVMVDLFGEMKSETNPTGWSFDSGGRFIPGTGSKLDLYLTSLFSSSSGTDAHTNPVMTMLTGFVRTLNGGLPTENDSSYIGRGSIRANFMQTFTAGNFDGNQGLLWLRMIQFNFGQDRDNGPDKGGTDYMKRHTQELNTLQGSANGFSGTVGMQMQQRMMEVTSTVDSSRTILEADTRATEKIQRNIV